MPKLVKENEQKKSSPVKKIGRVSVTKLKAAKSGGRGKRKAAAAVKVKKTLIVH